MSTREIRLTPFAQCYSFGQHGDPNRDGACLWCGRELTANKIQRHRAASPLFDHLPGGAEKRAAAIATADRYTLRGQYADGAFCGLRCGYAFGVIAALQGSRFEAQT